MAVKPFFYTLIKHSKGRIKYAAIPQIFFILMCPPV